MVFFCLLEICLSGNMGAMVRVMALLPLYENYLYNQPVQKESVLQPALFSSFVNLIQF